LFYVAIISILNVKGEILNSTLNQLMIEMMDELLNQ